MTLTRPVLMLAALLLAGATYGAESGMVGEESRSRFTIALALQPSIEITTASDIAIDIRDRTVDATYRQPFCVHGTNDTKYTVTASGNTNPNDEFVLRNDDNERLPFALGYVGEPARSSPDPLRADTPSPSYDILDYEEDCGEKTYFVVTFEADDLEVVGSGLYRGSVTFLVSPV